MSTKCAGRRRRSPGRETGHRHSGWPWLRCADGERRGVGDGEHRARAPALVIIDFDMPDVDGIELCRRVRETSHVPIIVVSGNRDFRVRSRGTRFGG